MAQTSPTIRASFELVSCLPLVLTDRRPVCRVILQLVLPHSLALWLCCLRRPFCCASHLSPLYSRICFCRRSLCFSHRFDRYWPLTPRVHVRLVSPLGTSTPSKFELPSLLGPYRRTSFRGVIGTVLYVKNTNFLLSITIVAPSRF